MGSSEAVKIENDMRWSGLEGGPIELVFQKDFHPIPAVETPASIEEDDESVAERILRFVKEFADILLRVANHRDRWTASQLVELLINTSFALNVQCKTSKALQNSKLSPLEIQGSL